MNHERVRRWTPETGELISRTLMLPPCSDVGCHTNVDGRARLKAGTILGILADAGLLLPPGSGSYDQYRTGDKLCCQLEAGSENYVHIRPEARHTHRHTVTTWPDGTVLTGPWIEVPQ